MNTPGRPSQAFRSRTAASLRPALVQLPGIAAVLVGVIPVWQQWGPGAGTAVLTLGIGWLIGATMWGWVRVRRRQLRITEDGRLVRSDARGQQAVDVGGLQQIWLHPDKPYWGRALRSGMYGKPSGRAPRLLVRDATGGEVRLEIHGVWEGDERWAACLLDAADETSAQVSDTAREELSYLAGRRKYIGR